MSKTFRDQLKDIRPSVKTTRKSPVYKSSLPPSSAVWMKDGYDHINISHRGHVFLGQILDLDYVRTWEHPILGSFRTVNNLWHFLKAKHKNDILRNAPIANIRYVVSKQCGGYLQNVQNFRYLVLDGMYRRVLAFKDIKQALMESELPFDSYRENDVGVRIRFENANWVCEGYTEIRKALKENRQPDFNHITQLRGKIDNLYDSIVAELTKHPSIPEAPAALISSKAKEEIVEDSPQLSLLDQPTEVLVAEAEEAESSKAVDPIVAQDVAPSVSEAPVVDSNV